MIKSKQLKLLSYKFKSYNANYYLQIFLQSSAVFVIHYSHYALKHMSQIQKLAKENNLDFAITSIRFTKLVFFDFLKPFFQGPVFLFFSFSYTFKKINTFLLQIKKFNCFPISIVLFNTFFLPFSVIPFLPYSSLELKALSFTFPIKIFWSALFKLIFLKYANT